MNPHSGRETQYDIKSLSPKYGKQEFSFILINKTRYDLEPTMINDDTGYKYNSYRGVIPINYTMRFSIDEQHYLDKSTGPQYNIFIKSSIDTNFPFNSLSSTIFNTAS